MIAWTGANRWFTVEDAFLLWAPNSFTPNNDGINDGFQVITSVRNPEDFQLTIYDRWGRTLATLTDKATAWTGEQVPDGVYTWTVSVRDSHGKDLNSKGHVTLLS
ncbi:MAG: gliding motility-associated C-terminal domain-containing protein [Flavobacteriales bacterium]|nr:gliding motility-associated C-terminal domain-containing protein [Flavobacteriales bacterium]